MATFANLWLFLIADPCSKLSTQETKSLRAHSIKSTRSQFLFSPGKNEIRLSYTHRANSWQSWQGRGPARERRRWCGTGWRTSWGADNRAIFPASRHRSTPRGLLWRGWLARDPVSKPETIKWESVVNMIFFFFSVLPCQPDADSRFSSSCPFDRDLTGCTWPVFCRWRRAQSPRDTLERCLSAAFPAASKPTFVSLPLFQPVDKSDKKELSANKTLTGHRSGGIKRWGKMWVKKEVPHTFTYKVQRNRSPYILVSQWRYGAQLPWNLFP